MACKYYYKGKELSYEEFAELLQNGLLQETLKRIEAGKPPVEPPKGKTTEGEGDDSKQRKRAVIASMIKSVPESQREKVEKDGLYYTPVSKVEALEIAEGVFKDNGLDASLDMARNPRVNGVVRSALYSKILNDLDLRIEKAANNQEAERLANEFADVFMEFGESGTSSGQFTAGIENFYKSPLGQLYLEEKRKEKIYKEKEQVNGKNWDEALDEFKKSEEFAAIVAEEVDKVLVKDKGFAKKAANSLRAKADKIEKEGLKAALPSWLKADLPEGTQQQGLDINAFNKAVATSLRIIANVIEAGGKLSEAVAEQAKSIKENLSLSASEKEIQDWLRQEYRNTGAVEKSFEEKVKDRIDSITNSIESLKKKIAEGKYEPKEKPVTNEEIEKLLQEKKQLEKQYNEIKKSAIGSVEKTEEQKVASRIETLNKSIETLKAKIESKEYNPSEKPVTNDEIKQLEKQRKELINQYNEIKKNSPAYKERMSEMFLDRFMDRLSGMNRAQKGEVVRRMFKKLVDSGGLEREEFRDIVADVLGLGKMTDQKAKEFKEYVRNISAIEEIAQEYVDSPTPENLKKFEKAQAIAVDSKRELSRIVYNQIDLGARVKQMIQLSVMSPPTLAKNLSWNFVEAATRSGENMAIAAMDRALQASSVLLNKATKGKTKIYTPQASLFGEIGAYAKAAKYGFKESINTLKKGTSSKDLFASTSVESPIQPMKSMQALRKELDLRLRSIFNKKLATEPTEGARPSDDELLDKTIQATAGIYAEFISRGLTFGDKPARYGPEAAKAVSMAKYELGIKDEKKLEIFAKFPKQSAYKYYKEKGLSEVEAKYRAEVFEKRALRQGERAVMQQDNILSDYYKLSADFLEGKLGGQAWYPFVSAPLKFVTTPASLFVKTPANVAWRVFKLANPEFALIEAGMQFNKAKKLKKAGDEAYKIELDDARQSLGTAAVGMGIASVVGSMVVAGIITPAAGERDKKERVASQNYEKGFTFNFSRFQRWITGQPLETPQGKSDLTIDLSWFGAFGSIMDLKARLYSGAKKEGDEAANYISQLAERLFESADVAANATIFEAQKTFTQALTSESGFNNYMSGAVSTWLSPLPFMGSMSRSLLPYEYRIKGDNFLNQLENRIAADNLMYRALAKKYPPSKIGLWGDKIERKDDAASTIQRYFGISKTNPDPFAQPIYNDFRKTMNPKFLPSEPSGDIQVEGNKIKLTQDQLDAYKQYVGRVRKQNVLVLLNSNDIEVQRGDKYLKTNYNGLTEKEKITLLNKYYDAGLETGKELFFADPKFSSILLTIPKKSDQEKTEENYLKKFN